MQIVLVHLSKEEKIKALGLKLNIGASQLALYENSFARRYAKQQSLLSGPRTSFWSSDWVRTLEYSRKSQTRLSHACCEGIHWEEVSALAAP